MFIHLLYIFLYITLSRSDEIVIKESGVGFVDSDDIAMIFYVTLENQCDKDVEVLVCMGHCCDTMKPNEINCDSMSLIGGDMGVLYAKTTKNVTLIYPNLYLMNRQGQCTVIVHYRDERAVKQETARIDFNTAVTNEGTEGCECPSVDMDSTQNCRPIDCVIKYSGMKSYYDSRRMECVRAEQCVSPPEQCSPEIGYSISINNCTNLNTTISKDDLHLLDNNSTESNNCMMCSVNNIVCHHGSIDGNNGQCECDEGWTTTTDEEMYSPTLLQYHMCNVEVGAWNCLNKGKIKTTTILIAIFAVTIASKILILMCILNWCYKRYRKNKDKLCSDKLDPSRKEIILCESAKGYDECLCDVPTKKPHFLETQTVNVSYYPCLPSPFTSFPGSSASGKCKCSINSEESIILSKTTSSSAPAVTFENESEGGTAGSEEERQDIEYSGEGSELDESAKEEEAYGEDGKSDVGEEVGEEYGEQSEYTGYSGNISRIESGSSRTKSMSTARKSRSSTTK